MICYVLGILLFIVFSFQFLFDWFARALSGYYSKKVEVPQEVVEGLWTSLCEILHSEKLCNVLSTGKVINVPPAVPQVFNALYCPVSGLRFWFKYCPATYSDIVILLNILEPVCLTIIVYNWVIKSFIIQKFAFFIVIRYTYKIDA